MRKNGSKNLIITYLVVLAITLFLINSAFGDRIRGWMWQFGGGTAETLSSTGRRAGGIFGFVYQLSNLKKQNAELTDKLTSLEVDRSKIFELERENTLLKRELGFIESDQEEELVPAKIIARDPTTFSDYIIINRGQNSGITENAAVITGGVLVGQVKEAYPDRARVTLVTSKDSIIQAMLQNSRTKGILKGGISGLTLERISQDADFAPGEYIVTSGLGGEIKEGILIGRADRAQSPESGILKSITVEPITDLSRLELVFVIKD